MTDFEWQETTYGGMTWRNAGIHLRNLEDDDTTYVVCSIEPPQSYRNPELTYRGSVNVHGPEVLFSKQFNTLAAAKWALRSWVRGHEYKAMMAKFNRDFEKAHQAWANHIRDAVRAYRNRNHGKESRMANLVNWTFDENEVTGIEATVQIPRKSNGELEPFTCWIGAWLDQWSARIENANGTQVWSRYSDTLPNAVMAAENWIADAIEQSMQAAKARYAKAREHEAWKARTEKSIRDFIESRNG